VTLDCHSIKGEVMAAMQVVGVESAVRRIRRAGVRIRAGG